MRRAVALAAVLVACSTSPAPFVVSLRLDSTMTDDGYSGAMLGPDLLAAADVFAPLSGRLVLNDSAIAAVRCATWSMDGAAATTNASGISVDCLYTVNLPEAARRHLLAHELGHAFGMRHVCDPDALMYPMVNPTSRLILAAEDATEWEQVHGGGR